MQKHCGACPVSLLCVGLGPNERVHFYQCKKCGKFEMKVGVHPGDTALAYRKCPSRWALGCRHGVKKFRACNRCYCEAHNLTRTYNVPRDK